MYELCELIKKIKSHKDHKVLFPPATKPSGTSLRGKYKFEEETFSLEKTLGGGQYGKVYKGSFGTRPCVIKINTDVQVEEEDINETIMQTRLYCHVKDRGGTDMAFIPEALFAASIAGVGRVLGMEVVDKPLLIHVQSMKSKQIEWLRTALIKLCKLLVLLQKDVSFMHGDMHGENIMVRNNHDIFIIDFGMSSATFAKRRLITSKRYTRVPFHSQLDLLTLMTSLREDFALSKHFTVAAWCGSFVQPFWTIVRDAVVSGKQTNLPFGALKTVRTALNEISSSGEVYYAHHLLYEDIGRVAYSECEPSTMLKRLQTATSVHTEPVQERIFERV